MGVFAANVVLKEDVQESADVEASMAALREYVQEEADVAARQQLIVATIRGRVFPRAGSGVLLTLAS